MPSSTEEASTELSANPTSSLPSDHGSSLIRRRRRRSSATDSDDSTMG